MDNQVRPRIQGGEPPAELGQKGGWQTARRWKLHHPYKVIAKAFKGKEIRLPYKD